MNVISFTLQRFFRGRWQTLECVGSMDIEHLMKVASKWATNPPGDPWRLIVRH